MSTFREISDSHGLVTVVSIEDDGFTRIHISLLEELLAAGGYTSEEVEV